MNSTRRPLIVFAVAMSMSFVSGPLRGGESAEFRSLMNVGKAHLENANTAEGIEILTQALKLEPRSAAALRNLARAHLAGDKPETAIQHLETALEVDPDSVATVYTMALAYGRQGKFDEAIPHFERAATLDPHTAAIRFQLSNAYNATGQGEKATEQLRETIRLDPLHGAAHYQLAMRARRAKNRDEYRRHVREFVRLRNLFGDTSQTPFVLEHCAHTAAEAAASANPPEGRAAPAREITVRFSDATDELFGEATARSVAALAVIDVDPQGRYTFFAADPDGRLSLMTVSPAGTFVRKPLALTLAEPGAIHACIVGNFHDDRPDNLQPDAAAPRFADVTIVAENGVRLLKRKGPDTFEDVTESTGLAGLTGSRARWTDYDHEGDLDLLIARATGVELWQNRGDGTFTNVTASAGIPIVGHTVDVAAADLGSLAAVDLVAARGKLPTLVYLNRRAGQFKAMPTPPGPLPAASRVLVDDLNNDGKVDVITVGAAEAIIQFGGTAHRQRIDLADVSLSDAALIDYDNDGWLDFCGVGHSRASAESGVVRIWRNGGTGPWSDATSTLSLDGLSSPPLRSVQAADVDADGDTDLLLCTTDAKLRVLRNEGGHERGQLKLRLLSFIAQTGGIGTHVDIRDDDFRVTRWVDRLSPVEIGIGARKDLDSVQTFWPDGVVNNQIGVAATRDCLDIQIVKFTVTGSCPFLYVWDGERFRFVTDLVGNSAIDLPLSRTMLAPSDGDELVVVGQADRFRPRDGAYPVRITCELREVTYLDHVRLLAVDHPRGTEIHSTDKLMGPPLSEPRALGNPVLPTRAHGDDGIDRTAALQEIDGHFAPPGPYLPPPLRGVCRPMSLTLEFPRLDASRKLVLALTGWIAFGTSSSNIGVSQNRAVAMILPRLEAQAADGEWKLIDANVGMPVGKDKTILCDLEGKLPPDTTKLRLTGTFEIRWDRIALFEKRDLPASSIHVLEPSAATLGWRGFSDVISRAPGHTPTPDFYDVADVPPWPVAVQGWCTRYGDVRELTAARDGKLVLLNAGDMLSLDFPADKLPPVPAGIDRTFLLYSAGWVKEADYNTASGNEVEPLPVPEDVAQVSDDWRLRYNTRWVPGDRFAR